MSSPPIQEIEFSLLPGDLAIFLDETGHELMQEGGQPVFGLGGCAVYGQDYLSQILAPWESIRAKHLPSRRPLHASDLRSLPLSPSELDHLVSDIGGFFVQHRFYRLAAIATPVSKVVDWMAIYDQVACAFMAQVSNVVQRAWPLDRIVFIAERSERLESKYAQFFARPVQVQRGSERVRLPVVAGSMDKAKAEPGLEVADFVLHAMQRGARRRAEGRSAVDQRDFRAVFTDVSEDLVSYMELHELRSDDAYVRGYGEWIL